MALTAATANDAVSFLPLNLADLESVRECAAAFRARGEPLHVLINNAGLAGRQGVTKQGFELLFGVNHLGHFLLTTELLGCLQASAPSRVVTVSSDAHYQAKGIDWDELRRRGRGITAMHQYAVSKLSNVLFTQELARRLNGNGVTRTRCIRESRLPTSGVASPGRSGRWSRPGCCPPRTAPGPPCTVPPPPISPMSAAASTTDAPNAPPAPSRPPIWPPPNSGAAASSGPARPSPPHQTPPVP